MPSAGEAVISRTSTVIKFRLYFDFSELEMEGKTFYLDQVGLVTDYNSF